ncbi:MAG: DUF3500 domain-containing protein [Actinomycetota bacterium]|nr:DUF3500 domain-containing protein [Actinomycetota bacterium]
MSARLVEQMRDAAVRLVDSLEAATRAEAMAPFDTTDRLTWTYLPGPRPGARLGDLDPTQRRLARRLLETALSGAGARTATAVMELDGILRELERAEGRAGWERRDPAAYWIRLLGDPTQPIWGWTLSGHHLAVHLTIVGDEVAATPNFFGANPGVVTRGPRTGWQVLRAEEGLARRLLDGLDSDQRRAAVVSSSAPEDITTRRDPVADPGLVPSGVAWGDLDRTQQRSLDELIRCYLGRVHDDIARPAHQAVVDGGLEDVTFAWAGSIQPRQRHYYAVKGATFLIEYDNTQDGANHVHTVWRDLRRDWGEDLLSAHHRRDHDGPGT